MYSCFYAFFDTDDSGVSEKKELQSLFLGFREHIDLPALDRSRMYTAPVLLEGSGIQESESSQDLGSRPQCGF